MASYFVTIGNKEYVMTFQNGAVTLNGTAVSYDMQQLDERTFSVMMDGRSMRVVVEKTAEGYHLLVNGRRVEASVESERERLVKRLNASSHVGHARTDIHAPMPALVVKLEVDVGDEVKPGQGLIILEAMKMENEIRAHTEGKVKEIFVTKGKAVEKGELLLRLE